METTSQFAVVQVVCGASQNVFDTSSIWSWLSVHSTYPGRLVGVVQLFSKGYQEDIWLVGDLCGFYGPGELFLASGCINPRLRGYWAVGIELLLLARLNCPYYYHNCEQTPSLKYSIH